jgi:hypothetical protein
MALTLSTCHKCCQKDEIDRKRQKGDDFGCAHPAKPIEDSNERGQGKQQLGQGVEPSQNKKA